jgi:tRNA threonylcarbamoyl adenosine modification protein YjeE
MKQTLFRGIKGVTSSRYRFYSHLSIRRELADEDETRKFGSRLASLCNKGDVVSLVGEMGSGKTIFCQGFIRKITGNDKLHVTSPTFLLDNQYLTQNNIKYDST